MTRPPKTDSPAGPACSVVIAAYNAAQSIGATIGSVLAQTSQDFEVIVVDDGSTDDTAAVVQSLADARVRLYRQENQGPSAARNAAIANATGRYVSTIDSDDLWLPRYLETMVATLEQSPDAAFAYTDAWALEESSGRFRRATAMSRSRVTDAPADPASFLEALIRQNFIYGSVTARREVLEQVGGFNASVSHSEDYELWLRIAAQGYRGVRAAGPPLAIVRDRAGARHHDERSMLAGIRDAMQMLIEHEPRLSPQARSVAQERLTATQALLEGSTNQRFPDRVRTSVRRLAAGSTREIRSRWRRLPEPPPDVAASFPELGRGLGHRSARRPAAPGK